MSGSMAAGPEARRRWCDFVGQCWAADKSGLWLCDLRMSFIGLQAPRPADDGVISSDSAGRQINRDYRDLICVCFLLVILKKFKLHVAKGIELPKHAILCQASQGVDLRVWPGARRASAAFHP